MKNANKKLITHTKKTKTLKKSEKSVFFTSLSVTYICLTKPASLKLSDSPIETGYDVVKHLSKPIPK